VFVGVVVSVCMCARIYLFTNGGLWYIICACTLFLSIEK